MENYLIDRETLGKFVDKLISQKYPDRAAAELSELRETSIRSLDQKISDTIFRSLNQEQLEKLEAILDRGEESEDVFQDFFRNAGVDIEAKISEAAQVFGIEFLGGKNG